MFCSVSLEVNLQATKIVTFTEVKAEWTKTIYMFM